MKPSQGIPHPHTLLLHVV